MNNNKALLFSLLSLFFSAQLFAQTYEGKQKDIDQILNNIDLFSSYVVKGETEKLVSCYSMDAKIFPGGDEILSGKELSEYWAPSGTAKVIYHKVTPSEITIVKKTAYDYGYYEGTTRFEDGTEKNWKGKYVIVWKKIGKEWKIYLDCWNRIKI